MNLPQPTSTPATATDSADGGRSPSAGCPSIRAHEAVGRVRYLRLMAAGASTAQDLAERVLAQIEAALRIAEKEAAPPKVIDDLRAIHRRLHQAGLRHDLQGSFF